MMAVISGIVFFSSCEKQEAQMNQPDTYKVNFDKFSLGVENNTLIFDSEEDLQGCIEYLNEIGDDHLDEFEKSIGYHSYRSTGKELPGYDEVMKTLINPNMENVICGYLTVSDFKNETAVAYKLEDDQLCDLANLDRSKLYGVNFTFDDDFFEFVKTGAFLKSASDYCIEWTDTDNDSFVLPVGDVSITVLTKAEYSRSFFYKYLDIFYQVHASAYVYNLTFQADYATRKDDNGNSICYYNKSKKDSKKHYFERSEKTGLWFAKDQGLIITFERRPYTGTSKLKQYNLEVDYNLIIEQSYMSPIHKHYYTKNYCLK